MLSQYYVTSCLFCTFLALRHLFYSFKCDVVASEGQGRFVVVGKGPVVSLCYCTDLTHQSEIKVLTVANIKGLLLACPVPRGLFLLSILIYCRLQGGSSLIMKGKIAAPEPHQARV